MKEYCKKKKKVVTLLFENFLSPSHWKLVMNYNNSYKIQHGLRKNKNKTNKNWKKNHVGIATWVRLKKNHLYEQLQLNYIKKKTFINIHTWLGPCNIWKQVSRWVFFIITNRLQVKIINIVVVEIICGCFHSCCRLCWCWCCYCYRCTDLPLLLLYSQKNSINLAITKCIAIWCWCCCCCCCCCAFLLSILMILICFQWESFNTL